MLEGKLPELYDEILRSIPVGFNKYEESVSSWKGFDTFSSLHEGVQDRKVRAMQQLGTLGGGNHFIEVCVDVATEREVWLVLHSGSRNIGKELAERHINTAKSLWRLSELPDPDLAYFIKGTSEYKNYMHDLMWAQSYAFKNREVMMGRLRGVLSKVIGLPFRPLLEINCHHNYVSEEVHYNESVLVTRKGAINAESGRMGIIPGSMGTHTYIVKGLGNAESFHSASHGAGRKMSRGQAKRTFTVEDLEAQTQGIVCPKGKDVLDEIPGAYKSIETVMANQSDLVEIVTELRQVLNVKG
jgi:tRNA-splicing ligase RtcB